MVSPQGICHQNLSRGSHFCQIFSTLANGDNVYQLYRWVKRSKIWVINWLQHKQLETRATAEARQQCGDEESCSHWLDSVSKFLTADRACVQPSGVGRGQLQRQGKGIQTLHTGNQRPAHRGTKDGTQELPPWLSVHWRQ